MHYGLRGSLARAQWGNEVNNDDCQRILQTWHTWCLTIGNLYTTTLDKIVCIWSILWCRTRDRIKDRQAGAGEVSVVIMTFAIYRKFFRMFLYGTFFEETLIKILAIEKDDEATILCSRCLGSHNKSAAKDPESKTAKWYASHDIYWAMCQN